MCGSDLSVKGGMVSVTQNYLNSEKLKDFNIHYIPTHINRNRYYQIVYFLWAYLKIICFLILSKIDVAHLHTAERGSFYRKAILVKTFNYFKIKTIMHHHAAEFELFYNNLSESKKKYVSNILESTDLNIVLGENFKVSLQQKAPKAKIEILHNAVNSYEYNQYNMDAKNILFLGVICERKGIYDLLEAIKILDNEIDESIKLLICGDGEMNKIKEEIDKLKINHRISHLGWITKEMKDEFMAKSMINVLPSYNEGLPMTILETMAYGIPNISTNIASIPNVLYDNINGFLIEPGDIYQLANKIKILINSKNLRNEFSEKSFQLIHKSFSLEQNIERLIGLYNKL